MNRKKSIENFEKPKNSKFSKKDFEAFSFGKNSKSKSSIKNKLKIFKTRINKKIPIKKMILFGSRTRGKTGKDVDVDIVIVSPKFNKLDFFQRGAKMYDYWNLDYPVDFLCYTPEEFNKMKKRITIVREAIETGVEI